MGRGAVTTKTGGLRKQSAQKAKFTATTGRGIAANLLGDCRAHSETVIPVFIPYLHIRISVAFRHLAYHLFAYGADEHAFVPAQEVVI